MDKTTASFGLIWLEPSLVNRPILENLLSFAFSGHGTCYPLAFVLHLVRRDLLGAEFELLIACIKFFVLLLEIKRTNFDQDLVYNIIFVVTFDAGASLSKFILHTFGFNYFDSLSIFESAKQSLQFNYGFHSLSIWRNWKQHVVCLGRSSGGINLVTGHVIWLFCLRSPEELSCLILFRRRRHISQSLIIRASTASLQILICSLTVSH